MKRTTLLITVLAIMLLSGIVFASEGTPEDIGLKPSPAHLKWGDRDTEIHSGNINALSFATNFNTGDIYAVVNAHTNDDSLIIYKSVDNGENWSELYTISISSMWRTYNAQIFYTDNDRLAIFARYRNDSDYYNIWLWEAEDSSDVIINDTWEQVDDADNDIDSIYFYDVDYADGYYYVAYLGIDTSYSDSMSIMALTCHEDSLSWPAGQILFVDTRIKKSPRISAGANGNVYVTFLEERLQDEEIRVKRSYNYGSSWLSSQLVSNSTYELNYLDIAASRDSSYQNVWFTVQYEGAETFGYYFSEDSCVNTQYGGIFDQNTFGWIPVMGSAACNPQSGFLTVAYLKDSSTSQDVYFTWARNAAPDSFYAPLKINQYNATGSLRPFAGNISGNSAIAYAGWGPQNVYFDYFGSTLGIDSKDDNKNTSGFIMPAKSVFSDNIEFSLMLNSSSSVDIALFDCSGRKVAVFNQYMPEGSNTVKMDLSEFSSGIYLYRAVSGNKTASGRLVKIR